VPTTRGEERRFGCWLGWGGGASSARVAVCGSNGFNKMNPRDSPNEPTRLAHQVAFRQLSIRGGSRSNPRIETLSRIHTQTERCEGLQRASPGEGSD